MELSEEAKNKLESSLKSEIGSESIDMLDDKDFNQIGLFFLSIFAEALKIKSAIKGI